MASKGANKYKKVSPYEVYLIDKEGQPSKRICGVQRNNRPKGHLCHMDAGAGTSHPGVGPCSSHDRQITNPNNTSLWHRLNREHNLPSTLMEFLDNARDIEDRVLASIDDDIKFLYALQAYFLEKKGQNADGKEVDLSSDNIELALKITDSIIKAKEKRVKIKKEIVLDATTVRAFIDQIFRIIMANTNKAHSRRILTEILDGVIMPFKQSGRISGDLGFTNNTQKIAKDVGIEMGDDEDSDFWENLEDLDKED